MKTIKVTNEMYNSLIELSKEMNSQDNLYTAKPVLFQVQTSKELPTCEGCGTAIWVDDDGNELRTKEDIMDCIADNGYDDGDTSKPLQYWDDSDRENWLENNDFRSVNCEEVQFLENAFFTRKACHEHLRSNGHNLRKPVCYVSHAFRNPEMELVSKFLYSLTNNELSK